MELYSAVRGMLRTHLGKALFIVGTFLVCSTSFSYGQETGSTLTGRVQDIRTGEYLENAQVKITGTNKAAMTDQYGRYRIRNAGSGDVTVEVFYTGFYRETQSVSLESGDNVLNVGLRSTTAYQEEDEIVTLDTFEVTSEADAYAAALNEQRFADTNKVVVDAEAFGEVTEGNIGEFVKYLPGISINYTAADARSINVRGMNANFTPVMVDGNKMASASSSSANRRFELEQVSMNNVERVEVTKVPRPDQPAESLGGQVNLISKSAFERDGRQIKYKLYTSINQDNITLSQTPGWGNTEHFKIYPGVDFAFADVYSDGDLGVIFNYKQSNQFNIQMRSNLRWEFDEYSDDLVDAVPVMRRWLYQDGPKFTTRESANLKMDYRIDENSMIGGSIQWNKYDAAFRNTSITWDTNVDERSDINDDDMEVSEDAVWSKDGGGDIDYAGSWRDKYGDTWHGDLKYKLYHDNWTFDAGIFYSNATNRYRSVSHGFLEGLSLDYDVPGRIILSDFGGNGNFKDYPTITVTDDDGNIIPSRGAGDLSLYDVQEITINRAYNSTDEYRGYNADFQYDFDLGEIPAYIKGGFRVTDNDRDARYPRVRYRFNTDVADPTVGGQLVNDVYSFTNNGYYNMIPIAWQDFEKGLQMYQDHPDWFYPGNRADANAASLANDWFEINEKIAAGYLMGQLQFMDNRMTVLGGFRYEKTKVDGWGSASTDDGFIDINGKGEYSGVYPSIAMKWDITDHLLLRAAYAMTIGRPNFSNIIPRASISYPDLDDPESDDTVEDGEVDIANPGLEPQEADNFDITLEYYTDNGGVLSAGIFRKDISGYIIEGMPLGYITQNEIDRLGIPSDTLGFRYVTDINGGDAKVEGFEMNVVQNLGNFGLPKELTVFANGTFLSTSGNFGGNTIENDLENFIKQTYNFGITFENDLFQVKAKYNYRGRELLSRQSWADDAGQYYDPQQYIDLSMEYRYSKQFTFFTAVRNLMEEPQDRVYLSPSNDLHLLERREKFGVQWTVGVKGEF